MEAWRLAQWSLEELPPPPREPWRLERWSRGGSAAAACAAAAPSREERGSASRMEGRRCAGRGRGPTEFAEGAGTREGRPAAAAGGRGREERAWSVVEGLEALRCRRRRRGIPGGWTAALHRCRCVAVEVARSKPPSPRPPGEQGEPGKD